MLIIWSAVRLVRDAADILLEAVPAGLDLGKVQGAIEQVPGVCHVHDFHIWSITSGHYALSGHVVVTPGSITGIDDNDRLLGIIKERLQRDFQIEHSTLQLESEAYEHLGEEACAPRRACDHLQEPPPRP
jgi:cobalt-zinc-cadmium efflux system protein